MQKQCKKNCIAYTEAGGHTQWMQQYKSKVSSLWKEATNRACNNSGHGFQSILEPDPKPIGTIPMSGSLKSIGLLWGERRNKPLIFKVASTQPPLGTHLTLCKCATWGCLHSIPFACVRDRFHMSKIPVEKWYAYTNSVLFTHRLESTSASRS